MASLTNIINEDEQQYLDLIKKILKDGNYKSNRTGIDTLSIFGHQMKFNLRKGFPLLTTKPMFWRAIVEELLWFISGRTDAKILKNKNINIWEGNSSKEFLKQQGFENREEGDLGPIYGFQWRHLGAEYKTCNDDYSGQGIDQLNNIINLIKSNPNDRRICLTAWNPIDIPKMALPPCHCFAQFYVYNNELSCLMYQRSADVGIGVPFNIASYALLTYMIAHICDLKVGDFIHTMGDAHIYKNHINELNEQIKRIPKEFPKLTINNKIKKIDDFKFEDFNIENYNPDSTIKLKMVA